MPENNNSPVAKTEAKKTNKPPSSSCPTFFRSLRFILGIYIFLNAIIISGIVIAFNIAFYTKSIFDLGLLYETATLNEVTAEGENFFEGIVEATYGFTFALSTSDGFRLPSDDPEFNVSKWFEPYRTAILTRSFVEALNIGTWFDDGSSRICVLSPIQHPDTLAAVAAEQPFQRDLRNYCVLCTMSSSYNAQLTNVSIVTEQAWYITNSSPVPEGLYSSANFTTAPDQRSSWFAGAKLQALYVPSARFVVEWGQAIALKVNPSQPAFVAFPLTFPIFNASGTFIGVSGVATSVSVVNQYLELAKGDIFSKNTEAIIVDWELSIYASSLARTKPVFREVDQAEYDTFNPGEKQRCQSAAESISTSDTTGVWLCIASVETYGYEPASIFFSRYTYVLDSDPFYGDSNVSSLFKNNPLGYKYVTPEPFKTSDGVEYVAAFGILANTGNNFHIGFSLFTHTEDFYEQLNIGQNAIFGTMAGAIIVAWILTWTATRYFLNPLVVVANKMQMTAHLQFEKIPKKKTRNKSSGQVEEDEEDEETKKTKNDNNNNSNKNFDESSLSGVHEIFSLEVAQRNMSNALNSFTKYLSREVVKDLQISGVSIGLTKKYSVILQSDIAGFTSLSESIETSLLSELLTEYFEQVCGIVQGHGSTIILFIGDAIVAGWSIVFRSGGNDEVKAAVCALEMQRTIAIQPLAGLWEAKANRKLAQRVGVNAGQVFAGVTGSRTRLSYSVSGPNYDFAGWLEAAGKKFGTQTTVSDTVAECIRDVCCVRYLMPVTTMTATTSFSTPNSKDSGAASHTTTRTAPAVFDSEEPSSNSNNNVKNLMPGSLADASPNASSTIQQVYELVGLLPVESSKLDDLLPPERNITQMSSGLFGSYQQQRLNTLDTSKQGSNLNSTPQSPSKTKGINSRLNSDAFGQMYVVDESPPVSPKSKRPRRFSDVSEGSGGANNNNTVAIEMQNRERASTHASTADSNEKFIERMTNSNRLLPAVKLLKRSHEHDKCKLFASQLEIDFSRDFSIATNFFESGNVQECMKTLDNLAANEKYAIFFKSVNDFGNNEEQSERAYAEAMGDSKKCPATMITAKKSAKLLYEQCKDSSSHQDA